MNTDKKVTIGHYLESFGYGLVGVGLFSYGTSYFQERLIYNVPRILIPIFEIFGNVGLAIGMLILGGGLIYCGFTRWKKASDKKILYWIVAVIGLAVGVVAANINVNPKKSVEIMEEINQNREYQMEELRNIDKLSFRNATAEEHIDNYNTLYKCFEQSLKDNNEVAIYDCEEKFSEWISKTADIMQELNNDQKVELARYQGKLSVQWNDLRMKYLKE